MNLKNISQHRIQDMSRLNSKETQLLPYPAYDVVINRDDHEPAHFHVISRQEGFDVRFTLDGEFLSVKRYGDRPRTDKFKDIQKLVKKWLLRKPANEKSLHSTNGAYADFIWSTYQD